MIEIVKRRRVLQNRLKQREHIRMKSSLHNSFSLWSSNSEIVYQVLDSICNASLPKISFCIRFDMELEKFFYVLKETFILKCGHLSSLSAADT